MSLSDYLLTVQQIRVGLEMCRGLLSGIYRQINAPRVDTRMAFSSIRMDATIDWAAFNHYAKESGIAESHRLFLDELREKTHLSSFSHILISRFLTVSTESIDHDELSFVRWAFPYISIFFNSSKLRCESSIFFIAAREKIKNKDWIGFFEVLDQLNDPSPSLNNALFLASTVLFSPHQSNPNLIKGYPIKALQDYYDRNQGHLTPLMQQVLPIIISYTDDTLLTPYSDLWLKAVQFSAHHDGLQATILFQWAMHRQSLPQRRRTALVEQLLQLLHIEGPESDRQTNLDLRIIGAECKMAMVTNEKMVWLRGLYRMVLLNQRNPIYPEPERMPLISITYDEYKTTLGMYCNTRAQYKSSEDSHVQFYLTHVIYPALFVVSSIGCCNQIRPIIALIPESEGLSTSTIRAIAQLKSRFALYLETGPTQREKNKQARLEIVVQIIHRRRLATTESVKASKSQAKPKKPSTRLTKLDPAKITETCINQTESYKKKYKPEKKNPINKINDCPVSDSSQRLASSLNASCSMAPSLLAPLSTANLKFLLRIVSLDKGSQMLRGEVEKLAEIIQKIGFTAEYRQGGSHLRLQITTHSAPDTSLADVVERTNWFRIHNDSVCVSNTFSHTPVLPNYQKLRIVQLLRMYHINEESIQDELNRRATFSSEVNVSHVN